MNTSENKVTFAHANRISMLNDFDDESGGKKKWVIKIIANTQSFRCEWVIKMIKTPDSVHGSKWGQNAFAESVSEPKRICSSNTLRWRANHTVSSKRFLRRKKKCKQDISVLSFRSADSIALKWFLFLCILRAHFSTRRYLFIFISVDFILSLSRFLRAKEKKRVFKNSRQKAKVIMHLLVCAVR